MSYPRNSPCPCGSGKKYKHCHYDKPFSAGRDLSVHNRNVALLRAAEDIFGFRRGRSWSDFKRTISGDQIRRFYEFKAQLWPKETDWESILPRPDGKLRGLYLGDIRPEQVLRNLVRFSLYSDSLLVIDPFHNPLVLRPEYNPIENPDQFKADTIRLVFFLAQIAPWLEADIVSLIPEPTDYDLEFKSETWRLAKERVGEARALDPRDLEAAHEQGREDLMRTVMTLPDEQLIATAEKACGKLTDQQKADFISHAKRKLREDPLALEQPPGGNCRDGQLVAMRGGTTLEAALLIENLTGAFPYTTMYTKWNEIMAARDEMGEAARIWTPLTRAFQELPFRFLDQVDPRFVATIRAEGRFESFRHLLRRIGGGAEGVSDMTTLDSFVRDCNDELISEHNKAKAEWDRIDRDFLKWAGSGAAGAMVGGSIIPDKSALAAGILHTLVQLADRHLKRREFRKSNPMSILIDLSAKPSTGGTVLI